MGGTIPELVSLGCLRKAAEQAGGNKPSSSMASALVPNTGFLPGVPASASLTDDL